MNVSDQAPNRIVSIVADTLRSHLVRIRVDDDIFLVDAVSVVRLNLREGLSLTPEQLEALRNEATVTAAKERALGLLSNRAYTKKEMSDRLARHDYDAACITQVVDWLCDLGVLDDHAYAMRWTEHRIHVKGWGPARIRHELRQRGVASDIVDEALSRFNESEYYETALRDAKARLLRMGETPLPKARRQIYGFLQRKGFTGSVISRVMRDLFDQFPA